MTMAEQDLGPKAWLFANHVDSLAACGLLMADVWLDKRSVTIDMLGDDFLKAVKTGDPVKIHTDQPQQAGAEKPGRSGRRHHGEVGIARSPTPPVALRCRACG
jgi:hypothetical protein